MRNVLCIIVLALGVTGLAACSRSSSSASSRPVHSWHWYQGHLAAMKATLKRCDKYHDASAMQDPWQNHPNCENAFNAETSAIWDPK